MKNKQPTYLDQLPSSALPGETAIVDGELWRCSRYSKLQPDSIKWRLARSRQDDYCRWTYSDDDDCYWMTDCGEEFSFIYGGPKENGMKFCAYCGKRLKEACPKGRG